MFAGVIAAMRRNPFILMLVLAAAGCGGGDESLTMSAASETVLEHLRSVAPLALNPDSFRTEIVEIGAAEPDDQRAVRFRTIWAGADTAGGWVDTSAVLTAWLRRDGGRHKVVRYDSALVEQLAEIVDEDRNREYLDVIEDIHHIYHAMTEHGWYYNAGGIAPDTIVRLVHGLGMHHGTLAWGLTPPGDSTAQILWGRSTRDTAAICALPLTWGRLEAPGFEWVTESALRAWAERLEPGVNYARTAAHPPAGGYAEDVMFNVAPMTTHRDAIVRDCAVLYRDSALSVRHSVATGDTALAFVGSTNDAHIVVNAGNTNYVRRADVVDIIPADREHT